MTITPARAGQPADTLPGRLLSKVPEVTIFFWLIKVLSTTVGETGADYLNETLGLGLTGVSLVTLVLLAVLLVAQVRSRRYLPPLYWATVLVISVAGTLVTDNLTDNLGVPLWLSTVVFSAVLLGVFGAWYARERTLAMHSIVTRSRECWYWAAILVTFALGTASGDLLSEGAGLGYLVSGLLFAGAIAVVVVAWRTHALSAVAAFWLAYIMTRPLGASIGDLLTADRADGGLGLGTTVVSVVFVAAIVAAVAYLTVSKRDRVAVHHVTAA